MTERMIEETEEQTARAVRVAFDAVEPGEEALARMWGGIEAAFDAEVGEGAAAAGVVTAAGAEAAAAVSEADAAGTAVAEGAAGTAGDAGFTVTPGARRRSGRPWTQAVAAVLVLAIGVGLGFGVSAAVQQGAMQKSAELSGEEALYMSSTFDDYDAPVGSAFEGLEESAVLGTSRSVLTDEDGNAYSANTLLVSIDEGMTAAQKQALCDKYGLEIIYDYTIINAIAVALDHDATADELAALKAALEDEAGVIGVDFDYVSYTMAD